MMKGRMNDKGWNEITTDVYEQQFKYEGGGAPVTRAKS